MRSIEQKSGLVYASTGLLQGAPWAGAQGGATLFDSILGADAASIDTGASGVASGSGLITIYIVARTADAGATGSVKVTLNGDTGANYDDMRMSGTNTTATTGNDLAQTSWATIMHGSGGSASYPGLFVITIPSYDKTTFWKVGTGQMPTIPDATAANVTVGMFALGWRSTAAINQVTVTGSTANLKAGSRLLVKGY